MQRFFGSLAGPRAGMKEIPRPLLQPRVGGGGASGVKCVHTVGVKKGCVCDGGQELMELWAQGLGR